MKMNKYRLAKLLARNRLTKLVLLMSVTMTVSACGANKKGVANSSASSGGAAVATSDITLPPNTIEGRVEAKQRDPEETISFDEWRKRRIQELEKEQNR